jgi:hypothetical protein
LQYAEKRPGLYRAIEGLSRVMAISRVGQHMAFTFLPAGMVYADRLIIFSQQDYWFFSALQCRVHEIWARRFSSTLKDDLMYAPVDCFETFPLPRDGRTQLESAGRAYFEVRSEIMQSENRGMTSVYNDFHDPAVSTSEIVRLRRFHEEMDLAALQAYGWSDLKPKCGFYLDYEAGEDEAASKKKKPWRFRWPDDFRDEVLGRLLALNKERAIRQGAAEARDKDDENGDAELF